MFTSIKVAYLLSMGKRARRALIFEFFDAYLVARPELLQAIRESLPASCVPPFDQLVADMRAADWRCEP